MLAFPRLYTSFPWVYHALYPVIYKYAKDFSCYNALLKKAGARRVLDVGCGTGILGRYITEAGYAYIGVDISVPMLRVARHHVAHGEFFQCDMRDLSPVRAAVKDPFDAVLCTGRTFSHLLLNGDVLRVLDGAAALLRPGGLFACDVIDARVLSTMMPPRNSAATAVGERVFRRFFVNVPVPGADATLRTTTHFAVTERGAPVVEFDTETIVRGFRPVEMQAFFGAAGFRDSFRCARLWHAPQVFLASACKA